MRSEFVRSDFAAQIRPLCQTANSAERVAAEFANGFNGRTQLLLSTATRLVLIARTEGSRVIRDRADQFTIVLHGEIYFDQPLSNDEIDEEIRRAYLNHGPTFFSKFDGSCVLLVVDTRCDLVAVITDRVNSRKVFHLRSGAEDWIATELSSLPRTECDPGALVLYVINGFVCDGRTVWRGVRQLERASIHQFFDGRITTTAYWRYEFTHEYENKTAADLRADLAMLLRKAAARRLASDTNVICSLSGGYDSRAVLGLLQEVAPRERIYCFSYGPDSSDDVTVARLVAMRHGLQHGVFNFRGDLGYTLKKNANLGQGLVDFMPSADVLDELAPRFGRPDSVMFSGDECFGWDESPPLPDEQKILSGIVGARESVNWPAWIFSEAVDTSQVVEEVATGWDRMRVLRKNFQTLEDFKSFLYLDQRLPNIQLVWREYYFGRHLPVRNLLLDRDILEFIRRLPDWCRFSRQLYRDAIREMFPNLFGTPIAAFNGNPLDQDELVRNQVHRLGALMEGESALDAVIPVERIRRLAETCAVGAKPDATLAAGSRRSFTQSIRSMAAKGPFSEVLRRTLLLKRTEDSLRLGGRHLERILVLRHALRRDD